MCFFMYGFNGEGIELHLDACRLINGLFSRVGVMVILILNAFGISILIPLLFIVVLIFMSAAFIKVILKCCERMDWGRLLNF